MLNRMRVEATELTSSPEVLEALIDEGRDLQQAIGFLTTAGDRLRTRYRIGDENPIEATLAGAKFSGLAGVLRLSPIVEVDLAPKFLGHSYDGWREDFIAICNITGEGRFLTGEPVRARYGASSDLASLIGRVFVDEFWRNHRQPLRIYRERGWRDWSLDGDIDFDRWLERDPEGVPQAAIVLDRDNPFTGVLARATELLIAEVRDPEVRNELSAVRAMLPTARGSLSPPPHLPSRHQRWAPMVELATQIVEGFDLTLESGRSQAPGFVVRTWQAWERLVYLALRQRLGELVNAHELHVLGTRNGEPFEVNPDVTERSSGIPRLLDAKYKTRTGQQAPRISQADVYEALAFMTAGGVDAIALLYPRAAVPGDEPEPCGSCSVFETVELAGKSIAGVQVEARGIGRDGGFREFAKNVTAFVEQQTGKAPATIPVVARS